MGRKGDITSKVIGVRTPIKIVTKLMNEASEKGISLSEYCVSLLSKDNFSQGGETKIEYKEKIVYRDKIIEVPVEIPINVRVPIDNPILIKQIESLTSENKKLKLEIDKLTPQPKPKMTEGYCSECRREQKLDEEEHCIKCGSNRIQPIKRNQY